MRGPCRSGGGRGGLRDSRGRVRAAHPNPPGRPGLANQVVAGLLQLQRHSRNLDELSEAAIEQDIPGQRVAMTSAEVDPGEQARLAAEGGTIPANAQAACGEPATMKASSNQAFRHAGKEFREQAARGAAAHRGGARRLPAPAPRAERLVQGGRRHRFWWRHAAGDTYLIKHEKGGWLRENRHRRGRRRVDPGAGGSAMSPLRDRAKLKMYPVDQATHQLRWQQGVHQGGDPPSRYRSEFEASWAGGTYANIGNATRRRPPGGRPRPHPLAGDLRQQR